MSGIEFQCPHCSARLRARDQTVAGRTISCPDCRSELDLELEGDGTLFARIRVQSLPASVPQPVPAAPPSDPASARPAGKSPIPAPRWREKLASPPFMLGLIIGGAVLAVVVGILISWSNMPTDRPVANAPDDSSHETEKPPVAGPPEGPDPAEDALLALGRQILEYEAAEGVFPAQQSNPALASHETLSWMAVLVDQRGVPQPPLWDRPWNDPLNARFAQQAIPEFRNPAFENAPNANGYPQTHFVGIAGVGADAPRLSAEHPRAGMFGTNRYTTRDSVADGLANTWMISPVESRFGPWSAGDAPTLRALTQQPYVRGPDGFGSGRPDAMPILMGDGSVRTISAQIDPGILESLATINDGLPRPAESPDPVPAVPVPSHPIVDARPGDNIPPLALDETPLAAPKPPGSDLLALLDRVRRQQTSAEPEPLDIERQLAQTISAYRQPRGVPLRDLLFEFEEMAGVPIAFEELILERDKARLDEPVRVTLEDAPSLKRVLDELVRSAGLAWRAGANRIEIVPAAAN